MHQLNKGGLFTCSVSTTFLEDLKQRRKTQKDWKFTGACAMSMRASVSPAPPFCFILNIGNSYTAASF